MSSPVARTEPHRDHVIGETHRSHHLTRPRCPRCDGLLKSDTVSFGEPIPPDVMDACGDEAARADCMIVVGTSATVYPAAGLPIAIADRGGDLIEVNPYPSELTAMCRVTLSGPAGEILPALVERVRQLR